MIVRTEDSSQMRKAKIPHRRLPIHLGLAAALAALVGCGPVPPDLIPKTVNLPPGKTCAVVPLECVGNRLLARVSLNGREAGYFLLDTGCTWNIVDRDIADRLGLYQAGEIDTEYGKRSLREVRTLAAGDILLGRHRLVELDLKQVSKDLAEGPRRPLAGVLGYPTWRNMPFTIDYAARTVTFHERTAYKPTQGAAAFELSISSQGLPTVQMGAGGLQKPATVDTGCDAWLTSTFELGGSKAGAIFPEARRRAALPASMERPIGTVEGTVLLEGPLSVLGHNYELLPVILEPKGRGIPSLSIGGAVLRSFRLTFDYQIGCLWAEWIGE